MTIKIDELKKFVEAGKTLNDIVVYYSMTSKKTKTELRETIEKMLKEAGLEAGKKESKAESLKNWFLKQSNPLDVTKDQIKKACESFDMKGGSVTYYVNAYALAIELTKKLKK